MRRNYCQRTPHAICSSISQLNGLGPKFWILGCTVQLKILCGATIKARTGRGSPSLVPAETLSLLPSSYRRRSPSPSLPPPFSRSIRASSSRSTGCRCRSAAYACRSGALARTAGAMDSFNNDGYHGDTFDAEDFFGHANTYAGDYVEDRTARDFLSEAPSFRAPSSSRQRNAAAPTPTPSHLGFSNLDLNADEGWPSMDAYEDILRSDPQEGRVDITSGPPPVRVPAPNTGAPPAFRAGRSGTTAVRRPGPRCLRCMDPERATPMGPPSAPCARARRRRRLLQSQPTDTLEDSDDNPNPRIPVTVHVPF